MLLFQVYGNKYEVFLNGKQNKDYPIKQIINYIEWYDTLNDNKFKDISPKTWKALNV